METIRITIADHDTGEVHSIHVIGKDKKYSLLALATLAKDTRAGENLKFLVESLELAAKSIDN